MLLAILVLLAALGPLAIVPGLSFHYDTVPRIVLLALGAAGLLLRPAMAGSALAGLWRGRSGRWLILLTAAQVAWFAVATLGSSRPWFSLLGNNWRRMGGATILALAVFTLLAAAILAKERPGIQFVLRATAIAVLLASIYGICQYFDLDPLQNPSGYHAVAGDSVIVRPPGTMGHADYFGWWLAVAGFCAAAMIPGERGFWRGVGITAVALGAAAVVLTGTRAAMLGAAVGLGALALAGRKLPWPRILMAAGISAGVLAVFYISPAGERLRARVRWAGEEPLGGARPLLWRDSVHLAAAHPVMGTGPETFAAAFPQYQSEELSRLLPDYYHESPHNMALDALAEQGVPGVLLAFAWLGLAWVAGRAACRARAAAAPALLGAVAASSTAGMFGVATAGPIFATLLAIAILTALGDIGTAPPADHWPRWLSIFALPLALFASLLAWSDFALARGAAIPAPQLAAQPRERPGRIPGAGEDLFWSRHLSTACGSNPECMRVSISSAARATDTADNPALAWYNLAIFSSMMGDAAGVEKGLRTATGLAPNWFKPHWSLANLLLLTGRMEEARREAERAAYLDAGKDAEVTATLQRALPAKPAGK